MRVHWPRLLILSLLFLAAGCAGSVRSFRIDEHVVRIDEHDGRENARIYVDDCAIRGVYYDERWQRWGVHGYTYGPSYFDLSILAEDLATWGAAQWCDPRRTPPGLGQRADTGSRTEL